MHIALMGPPASGKTTLGRDLAHHIDIPLIEEPPPPPGDGFCTQVQMITHRATTSKQRQGEPAIFDRHWIDDVVFARVTLSAQEFDLYYRLREALIDGLFPPAHIIMLSADKKTLGDRILQRGTRTSVLDILSDVVDEYEALSRLLPIKYPNTRIHHWDTTYGFPGGEEVAHVVR